MPTGVFSDLVGRKKTIIYGTLAALTSLIFYTIGSSYWLLVIGALFHGLCLALYSGNNDAYLHNILKTENLHDDYHHYRGKMEMLYMLGTSIGALVGGFLASQSFTLLMWFSMIPLTIALFVTTKLMDVPKSETQTTDVIIHLKDAMLAVKNNRNLRLLSLSRILGLTFGPAAYQFQSAVYNSFWPLWAVGFARALGEWIAIPGTYFSGKIIERFGAFKVMLVSNIYGWLVNVIAVIIPTKVTPLLISTSGVLWGPGDIAKTSLLQKEFTERQRATIASLNSLVGSILFAIFAYFIGLFADHYGPVKALLLIQLFIFPTLFLNWKLYKMNRVSADAE